MFKFESVTVFNNYVKDALAADSNLNYFELKGEISDFKIHSSGHAYFTVKDNSACVSCVMYRNNVGKLEEIPAVGDKVTITGSADFYPVQGRFQVKVFAVKKTGAGDLHEQFMKLYEKLKKEGLFDESHKVKVPVLPSKIGIVTSATGDVIHDIINTLQRRNPHFHIVIYPAAVQGDTCPYEVTEGLKFFEDSDVDVVIVARGGGSYEHLFGFNDEGMARQIYSMSKPVISAIGHDPDYTICDYVADLRAPTPTGAAELVLAKYSDIDDYLSQSTLSLSIAMNNLLESRRHQVEALANHKALVSPLYYADSQKKVLDNLEYQINTLMTTRINNDLNMIKSIDDRLDSLNPNNVLKRGYSFVSDSDGRAIESIDKLACGSDIKIVMSDGNADARITKTYKAQ